MKNNYQTRVRVKEGMLIVLNKELQSGDVSIRKYTSAKVIKADKAYEVDALFNDIDQLKGKTEFNTDWSEENRLRGFVLCVKRENFAVNVDEKIICEENLYIEKKKLVGIPYLDLEAIESFKEGYYVNNEREELCKLVDVIENIEENFEANFTMELETRPVNPEYESFDCDEVFTDEAFEQLQNEIKRIKDVFMEKTTYHYDFRGGTFDAE